MTSYHEQNKRAKLGYILGQLGEGDVALVSEAGTPAISDPGYELIVAASQQGIPVVPIPGPSAIITALVISGLPTDRFIYIGFLPRKSGDRQRLLESVADEPGTIIALETPHREVRHRKMPHQEMWNEERHPVAHLRRSERCALHKRDIQPAREGDP